MNDDGTHTLDATERLDLAEDLRGVAAGLRGLARRYDLTDRPGAQKRADRHRKLAERLDAWSLELDPPDDGAVYDDAAGQRTETQ